MEFLISRTLYRKILKSKDYFQILNSEYFLFIFEFLISLYGILPIRNFI